MTLYRESPAVAVSTRSHAPIEARETSDLQVFLRSLPLLSVNYFIHSSPMFSLQDHVLYNLIHFPIRFSTSLHHISIPLG